MEAPLRALLFAILLVPAGCIGALDGGDDADAAVDAQSVYGLEIPPAPEPLAYLLCQDDALVALSEPGDRGCNAQATHDSGPAAEVHVAVNPLDPLNLVGGSKDFTLGEDEHCGVYNVWSGVYTSFDGGRTWDHQLLPGYPGDERETVLSQYHCGSDPVIAFGPDGVVYYVGIYFTADPDGEKPPVPELGPVWGSDSINSGLAVTRSLDGGRTWEDPVSLGHVDEPEGIFDKEWIAVDPVTGQVYVSYIFTDGTGFHVQRSDDGGLSWTEPMQVPTGDAGLGPGLQQFAQIAVTPDSTLHFTYWSTSEEDASSAVYHRSSTDGGATWSEAHEVAPFAPVFDLGFTHKYRIVPNPALAVDGSDGTLYVVYPFYAGGANVPAGNMDILAVRSDDGGVTWSEPALVNDELVSPANGQWMPAVAVGPDGTVHASWIDYRDDPSGQFGSVYYAYSADRGATWSANARISDVPFDGEGGYHQSGSGTVGDYMGIAVSEQAVVPFWADTRNERNDVFAAIIPARGA